MTKNNRNLQQETDSAVSGEPRKIGLVKMSFQSGRTELLESDTTSNLPQIACGRESICSPGMSFFERLIVCGLNSRILGVRVRFSPGIHGLIGIVLAVLGLGLMARGASAQDRVSETSSARSAVVVFADRPMQDRQWNALFAALRTSKMTAEAETGAIGGDIEFIRGDKLQLGMQVKTAIVVYLHGDCILEPLSRRTAYGVPLGWVLKVHGRIEPFVHVDCTRIGGVLGPQGRGLDADERNGVMAGAIARVIAHEWIHIATQSSSHAVSGIEKAEYGVADLMAREGEEPLIHRRRFLHPRGE